MNNTPSAPAAMTSPADMFQKPPGSTGSVNKTPVDIKAKSLRELQEKIEGRSETLRKKADERKRKLRAMRAERVKEVEEHKQWRASIRRESERRMAELVDAERVFGAAMMTVAIVATQTAVAVPSGNRRSQNKGHGPRRTRDLH